MTRALINIDYTVDFVADEGTLTSGKPGQQIEETITKLTNMFIEKNDFVVFAIDAHHQDDRYHPETKLFPSHNIIGSEGRQLFGSLNTAYQRNKYKENV